MLGHVLDREHCAQPCHVLGQASGHPSIGRQPTELFQLRSTPRAGHAPPRQHQVRRRIEDRQIAHPPPLVAVYGVRLLLAPAANPRPTWDRLQLDVDPSLVACSGHHGIGIAFPVSQNLANLDPWQR